MCSERVIPYKKGKFDIMWAIDANFHNIIHNITHITQTNFFNFIKKYIISDALVISLFRNILTGLISTNKN